MNGEVLAVVGRGFAKQPGSRLVAEAEGPTSVLPSASSRMVPGDRAR